MRFYYFIVIPILFLFFSPLHAQESQQIKWLSFPEAEALQKVAPKKMMVYLYFTECRLCGQERELKLHPELKFLDEKGKEVKPVYEVGCDFCQKMEQDTWTDPKLIEYVNQHYYMVSLDASSQDTIHVRNRDFVSLGLDTIKYKNSMRSRIHQLAYALTEGKELGYPVMIPMDEKMDILARINGYRNTTYMMEMLRYVVEEKHKNLPLTTYIHHTAATNNRYFAIRYYTGQEPKNLKQAKALLLKAEKHHPEDPLTQMWMAIFQATGECGFEKSHEKSNLYASKAAPKLKELLGTDKDRGELQFLWGLAQLMGMGVEQNPQKALEHIKNSVETEFVPALLIYADILDGQDRYKEAFQYYEKAAQESADYAMSQLGLYYSKGKGIEKDAKKAQYWYKRACYNGEKKACEMLEKEKND